MSDAIEQAALRLREAGEKHRPCAPIRDSIAFSQFPPATYMNKEPCREQQQK